MGQCNYRKNPLAWLYSGYFQRGLVVEVDFWLFPEGWHKIYNSSLSTAISTVAVNLYFFIGLFDLPINPCMVNSDHSKRTINGVVCTLACIAYDSTGLLQIVCVSSTAIIAALSLTHNVVIKVPVPGTHAQSSAPSNF